MVADPTEREDPRITLRVVVRLYLAVRGGKSGVFRKLLTAKGLRLIQAYIRLTKI